MNIEENKKIWNDLYTWPQAGDEWSQPWGNVSMQWNGTLLPRIQRFLPVSTVLEIAPGYGRWTQFIKNYCSSLNLIDLSENCIAQCQERFAQENHIKYYVNDGKSLDMIDDNNIDFVFSFDSLVHLDDVFIEHYISEISKKLTPNGVAFIHHSNLGNYKYQFKLSKIPKLRGVLRLLNILEYDLHSRSPTMTAEKMEKFAELNGLQCISQELLNWRTKNALIDCISILVKKDSYWIRENRVIKNFNFMKEAENFRKISNNYS